MLVFSVIVYLDGFAVFYKFMKEYVEERKRKQELQAQQEGKIGGGDGEGNGRKRADMDTDKSIEENSEEYFS